MILPIWQFCTSLQEWLLLENPDGQILSHGGVGVKQIRSQYQYDLFGHIKQQRDLLKMVLRLG
jgi:hypothetical protein